MALPVDTVVTDAVMISEVSSSQSEYSDSELELIHFQAMVVVMSTVEAVVVSAPCEQETSPICLDRFLGSN